MSLPPIKSGLRIASSLLGCFVKVDVSLKLECPLERNPVKIGHIKVAHVGVGGQDENNIWAGFLFWIGELMML